jgi:L-alanine-DL-glutamate epimerase-like enolase superfamily enzyme
MSNEFERMVNAIKQTRERVGPDGTVMFDANCAVPPATPIQLAAAVKAYDVLFFEEFAVPGLGVSIDVEKMTKIAVDPNY